LWTSDAINTDEKKAPQLFGGGNGWPATALAIRESRRGQPSLTSAFGFSGMMIGPYHSPLQSSVMAVARSALTTFSQDWLSSSNHHPSDVGMSDQPAEPGAARNEGRAWLGGNSDIVGAALMRELDR
jgi:hypothetical protein